MRLPSTWLPKSATAMRAASTDPLPPTSETTPLWSPITPITNLSLVWASAVPTTPARAIPRPAPTRRKLRLTRLDRMALSSGSFVPTMVQMCHCAFMTVSRELWKHEVRERDRRPARGRRRHGAGLLGLFQGGADPGGDRPAARPDAQADHPHPERRAHDRLRADHPQRPDRRLRRAGGAPAGGLRPAPRHCRAGAARRPRRAHGGRRRGRPIRVRAISPPAPASASAGAARSTPPPRTSAAAAARATPWCCCAAAWRAAPPSIPTTTPPCSRARSTPPATT